MISDADAGLKQYIAYHTAYDQEPNDYLGNLHQIYGIGPWLSIYGDILSQEVKRDVEIEYGADSNRTEEADVDGLALFFDLVDAFTHGEYDRRPAQEQDKDTKRHETIDGDDIVGVEFLPWANGTYEVLEVRAKWGLTFPTEPNEDGYIE